jgi:hypothetical protein
MAKLKYLETALANRKCIHKEFKSRLNFGNVCCHAVQNPLSFRLVPKNLNIKIQKP